MSGSKDVEAEGDPATPLPEAKTLAAHEPHDPAQARLALGSDAPTPAVVDGPTWAPGDGPTLTTGDAPTPAIEDLGGHFRLHGRATSTPNLPLPELLTVPRENYELGEEIARGGMGRILKATDRRLGRSVAIKELLSSEPTWEARFKREMKITARLQHPAIIRVHEAGVWPDGTAFYSMKLVDGRPMDEAIQDAKDLPGRLKLLRHVTAVAEALAYAHDRGVIHRDLKPANVLLGDYGETVVIDWGLAKQLDDGEDEESEITADGVEPADSQLTILGFAMGTPAYMSPEQAVGNKLDERADVYSLGAMLYHLLAGKSPYSGFASAREVVSKVLDGPPRPLSEVEGHIHADLLAIVEKAMARKKTERYPSARELAEDLKRFETGQLVSVREYSSWALLGRWTKRHKAVLGVALVMALGLITTVAISVARISSERDRAQESRVEVEELLTYMLGELHTRLKTAGRLDLLDTVAQRAVEYYAERPVRWQEEEEVARRGDALIKSANVDLLGGAADKSVARYEEAMSLYQEMLKRSKNSEIWQLRVATVHENLGEIAEQQGDLEAAMEQQSKALSIRASAAQAENAGADVRRSYAFSLSNVASLHRRAEDREKAMTMELQSFGIREQLSKEDPDNPAYQVDLAFGHNRVGELLEDLDRPEEAQSRYQASLAINQQLVRQEPDNIDRMRNLVVAYNHVGDVARDLGKIDDAFAYYQKQRDLSQSLVDHDPMNTVWQADLALGEARLGKMQVTAKDYQGARKSFQNSLTVSARLVEIDPDNKDWQRSLEKAHVFIGEISYRNKDYDDAVASFETASTLIREQLATDGDAKLFRFDLGQAQEWLGLTHEERNDFAAASTAYRNVVEVRQTLADADPDNPFWQRGLARGLLELAKAQRLALQSASSLESAKKCTAVFASLPTKQSSDNSFAASCYALAGEAENAYQMLAATNLSVADMEKDLVLKGFEKDREWQAVLAQMRRIEVEAAVVGQ